MRVRELLGWNVRRLRVERGLSQERLAHVVDIDRTYAGRIERGEENVTIGVVEALAEALSVPVADLFAIPEPGALPPARLPAGRPRGPSSPN